MVIFLKTKSVIIVFYINLPYAILSKSPIFSSKFQAKYFQSSHQYVHEPKSFNILYPIDEARARLGRSAIKAFLHSAFANELALV
jgi:hypothetical protein